MDTMSERVTLLLGKDRVEIPREDLISKSEYFACLFSPNFIDHQSCEHRIQYDIDINTLKTFVGWIFDDVPFVIGDRRYVKPSLQKYTGDSADFEGLLQLLQLSVLFASEALIRDLMDLIACHWLVPQKCVQIWLLARDLALVTLRDLAKATCIDRLQDVPESLLLELSGEDLVELVGNIHVEFTSTFPLQLLRQWVDCNVSGSKSNAFESHHSFKLLQDLISYYSSDIKEIFEDQYWEHNIQCIVGRKRISKRKATKFIYGWDGTSLFEVVNLPSAPPFFYGTITGMRAVGRGFDIYLVGGEYGRDSGYFQTEIWRYSLISKTWYYVTSMPRPRQDMAISFLNGELFLMGGGQSFPPGIATVDVYNIHTGQWRYTLHIQGFISADALICKKQGSLLISQGRNRHWYDADKNLWVPSYGSFFGVELEEITARMRDSYIHPEFWMTYGSYMYVLGLCCGESTMKIFSVEDLKSSPIRSLHIGDCVTWFTNQVSNGPYLVGFADKEDTICVQVMKMIDERSLESKIIYKQKKKCDDKYIRLEEWTGCFNVYNPTSLNELFVKQ